MSGVHIIAHPSAEYEILMTDRYRSDRLRQHTAGTSTAYIHVSAGFGESTRDHVHAGAAAIWENGELLSQNERFSISPSLITADIDIEKLENLRRGKTGNLDASYTRIHVGDASCTDFEAELHRRIEPHPFSPESEMDYRCREIFEIQVTGLATRLRHINCQTAVLGISGGLDSTLALLVVAMAFDKLGWSRERIIGVTMPGYGTT
jgi:NAD+ synthase (glutamine-hydrolysing)